MTENKKDEVCLFFCFFFKGHKYRKGGKAVTYQAHCEGKCANIEKTVPNFLIFFSVKQPNLENVDVGGGRGEQMGNVLSQC